MENPYWARKLQCRMAGGPRKDAPISTQSSEKITWGSRRIAPPPQQQRRRVCLRIWYEADERWCKATLVALYRSHCRFVSVALSLCTSAHPLHTRFSNILGAAVAEATMRPGPRITPASATVYSPRPPPAPGASTPAQPEGGLRRRVSGDRTQMRWEMGASRQAVGGQQGGRAAPLSSQPCRLR